MYHYQKNIGDYRSATMHLSLLEHGVYNQLLDWYYLEETPIPNDNRTLYRRLSAKTEDEQKAVLEVLNEMFLLTDGVWVHRRVEREIAQYREKSDKAKIAGKLGGRPLKKGVGSENKPIAFQEEATAKPTANREPLTVNCEPQTDNPKQPKNTRGTRLPENFEPDFQFAVDQGLQNTLEEAHKFRDYWHAQPGQKGVKTDWPATWRNWCRNARPASRAGPSETPYQRSKRELYERAIGKNKKPPIEIFDQPLELENEPAFPVD